MNHKLWGYVFLVLSPMWFATGVINLNIGDYVFGSIAMVNSVLVWYLSKGEFKR